MNQKSLGVPSPGDSTITIANFTAIGVGPSPSPTKSMNAAQCQIKGCTKLFRARQSNGILEEQLQEAPRLDFTPFANQSTP